MTVIIEFSIPAEAISLGRATNGDPDTRVQLERLVPMGIDRIPFMWATNDSRDFEAFERHLRESEIVNEVEALAQTRNSTLYYVEWYEEEESFLNGICDVGGVIMAAHGDDRWLFTVRFRDHGDLTRFHQFYQAHDYPVQVNRVYAPEEESEIEFGVGLTPEQRETLLLAVEEGYFSVPRGTNLEEIAEELDITRQAASERVRRGVETVLQKSLVGLLPEDFPPRSGGFD